MTPRQAEGGVAMVVAVLVITVLALTATTVVEVASRDILQTRRATAVFNARSVAEGALDLFAARAAADPGFVDAVAGGSANTPPGPWLRTDAFGRSIACADREDLCASTRLVVTEVLPGDTERRLRAAVVEVTARDGCRAARRCTYVRVQQRLERRTFFDFLLQTDRELMDPALLPPGDGPGEADFQRRQCETGVDGERLSVLDRPSGCVVPAWFGSGGTGPGDDVRGPVHTNDERIPHCGNPSFRAPVETTRAAADGADDARPDNTFSSEERTIAACGPPRKAAHAPVLGPGATLRKAPPIAMPPNVDHLDRAASGGHGLRWPAPGAPALAAVDLTLHASGLVSAELHDVAGGTTCACEQPTPDSGVVFVDAPVVRVAGTSPFPITVATTGEAVVDGDLLMATTASPAAAIGIVASGAIRLRMQERVTGAIRDRRLNRVALISLDHTIVTDRWDDPGVCTPACPTLDFTGAIVGRYRPVIGSYDAVTGAPSGGYRKQLAYQPDLAVTQPPYALMDAQTAWRRVDVTEAGA